MSRVRRGKAPPDGWDMIESTLEELNAKMKEATSETHEGIYNNIKLIRTT